MRFSLYTLVVLGPLLGAATPVPDTYQPKSIHGKPLKIVKTETNSYGQVIDWVLKESQGEVAKPPTLPEGKVSRRNVEDILVVRRGPEGTVPMLRPQPNFEPVQKRLPTSVDDESQRNSRTEARDGAQGQHWYASTAQNVNNYGGLGTFSLFNPYVQSSSDFSLLQTAIIHSNSAHAGTDPVTQTVEAGWINYPQQVEAAHLFSFYTTNGYAGYGDNISGWNLDYAGFVQSDTTIYPGQPLQPYSVRGGEQHDIEIGYVFSDGNWWLYVGDRFIGYYPGSLFSQGVDPAQTLATGATDLNFYGEIYNSEVDVTTTDMGSGEFPEAGASQTAYIHNIDWVNADNQRVAYDGSGGQVVSDTNRYRQILHFNSGTNLGSYMDLGGPGAGGVVDG